MTHTHGSLYNWKHGHYKATAYNVRRAAQEAHTEGTEGITLVLI